MSSSAPAASSKSTQELLARIRDLEIENMELKSKLDQYQSVFPATGGPPISGGPGASPPAAAPTERKVAHGPLHPRKRTSVRPTDSLPFFPQSNTGVGWGHGANLALS